jgi:plasmid maintenance system antidote protein VapI
MTDRTPAECFPVGEYLAEDLQERGWSEVNFAGKLGWSLRKTHWLLYHDGMLMKEDAERLTEVLGTSTELWLNIQAGYFEQVCQELWDAGMRPSEGQ